MMGRDYKKFILVLNVIVWICICLLLFFSELKIDNELLKDNLRTQINECISSTGDFSELCEDASGVVLNSIDSNTILRWSMHIVIIIFGLILTWYSFFKKKSTYIIASNIIAFLYMYYQSGFKLMADTMNLFYSSGMEEALNNLSLIYNFNQYMVIGSLFLPLVLINVFISIYISAKAREIK